MKKTKFISITLSVALISALGLSGCGGSSEAKIENTKTDTLSVKKQGYNAVSGKITLDESPNSKIRALTRNQADITAYNLDDNSIYKTTSNSNGDYELSGLSDGDYQVFAENDQYAKNAIQRVTLKKGTRAVVDFSLTASGSVSGKITGASFVYIPGTDHVSVTDADGNFALTGIPVGTYMLMYEADHSDQRESIEVEISAGAVTTLDMASDFSEDRDYGDEFGYINTSLELGVLELHHEGIPFRIYNSEYHEGDYFPWYNYISLKNSAGENIPFKIDFDYERHEPTIRSKEIVPAGEYTLTFAKEISEALYRPINEDRVYTFSVEAVSVAETDMEQGARFMQVYLPVDVTDAQKDALADLKVVEKGTTTALTLKSVWGDASKLSLFGSFKTGVEYEMQPTDEQKAILGTIKFKDGLLAFGDTRIDDMYPSSGFTAVRVDQNLYVNIEHANQLDPSTVKFTLNTQEYTGKDILFNGQNNYYDKYGDYRSSRVNISFKHDKLAYGTEYTLTFSAKDMSGNEVTETTTFTTMTPSIVEMEPEDIEDLFDDRQKVAFNVPVDKESGTITIENLTDGALNAEVSVDKQEYDYNLNEIYFDLRKLAPNQRYKITAAGFKDIDGVAIDAKSIEFSTPPRMLFVPDQYRQNMNVSGEHFNHKVNLFFFGGLTDAEKTSLEETLTVTSYGQPVTIDETHPVRKLFFIEEDSGITVSVAFTIDPDTNYELSLSTLEGMAGIILPDNTKLVSFATVRKDDSATDQNALRVIERLSVQQPYLQEKYDGTEYTTTLVSHIDMDVRIPLGYARLYQYEDGNTSYPSCQNQYDHMTRDGSLNDLIEESLHVTVGTTPIDVDFSGSYSWHISENWVDNDTRLCYAQNNSYYVGDQPIASFEADYNKTYEVSLDFTDTIESNVAVSNAQMSKMLKTAPVGTMNFSLTDGSTMSDQPYDEINERAMAEPNMIMLHMHSNAPMKTDNIDDLFNVKVNGENFEPRYDFYKNDMNLTTDISFAVPRTLYSLLQLELSKVDGQNMTFINPLTGEEVVNNSSITEPIMFVEDVAPDLMPVKIEEVQTTSIQNNEIYVEFNRPVNPDDVATVSEDGTVTDVAFEIKANDDTTVNIVGAYRDYNGVALRLAEDLNSSKTYTLSLKTGESIKAAFGAQELKEFSQEIELTYLEMGEIINISQQGSVGNDPENPYIMESIDLIISEYENSGVIVVPVNSVEGAVVDLEKSHINVKNALNVNDILNKGSLIYDQEKMMLIQPIREVWDSVNVDAEVIYTVNGQELSVDARHDHLNQVNMPYVDFYHGNGENAITFRIENMDYNYQITSENFVVYNEDGEVVDADITVQLDRGINEPTVMFNSLDPDSIYAVEIKGIPGYNMSPDMINSISIDTIFIATLPAAP